MIAIADQDATDLSAEAMVCELIKDNTAYIALLRAAKEAAGTAGDNATDGVID